MVVILLYEYGVLCEVVSCGDGMCGLNWIVVVCCIVVVLKMLVYVFVCVVL